MKFNNSQETIKKDNKRLTECLQQIQYTKYSGTRDEKIMFMRLRGMTYENIGKVFGISRSRVDQIIWKLYEYCLRKELILDK